METRILIAYALIALLAAFFGLLGWRRWTRPTRERTREQKHRQTMHERWLALRPPARPADLP